LFFKMAPLPFLRAERVKRQCHVEYQMICRAPVKRRKCGVLSKFAVLKCR
jgi:hypothetical protein